MKSRITHSLLAIIFLCLCSSCSSFTSVSSDKHYIHHVVIAWLKQPGDTAAQQALIDGTRTLADIPGVVSVSAGRTFASERSVVDDSFDIALTVVLKDHAALNSYQNHPLHNRVKRDVLKPLVARYIVYNYVD
ncbi:MAG: Dabb family protein [Pseudomonadales bacterium]|nr:Dabb family protein [Pseudomonadales bacterium]